MAGSFQRSRSIATTCALIVSAVAACGPSTRHGDDDGTGGDASGTGSGSSEVQGCQYVDLLFVIDNSPSMGRYQEALAQVFPSFVDAIYEELPSGVDVHVGITTTSFYTGSCSESVSNCVTTATAQQIDDHYVKPTIASTGTNGEQGRLFRHEGKYFFAANTSDLDRAPLKQWFSGAAVAAGEHGCSFEMASAAAGYAAHPANAATNGGFLRDDDAVLVVIFLSDEPDKSPEGVAAYHAMLTAAKQQCGGDACILAAGIIDPCTMTVNNVIWQTLNAFGEPPIIGDIDDTASYSKVVGDALAQVVQQTCEDIVLL